VRSIDINCDCGESFGNWRMGADEDLLPLLTTANVACGFHAGDPQTMMRTVNIAKANGIAVGAHPGLPDLMGFGRRKMDISADEAYAYVIYQAGALRAALNAQGLELHHVKPHGALYAMLNVDDKLAEAVAQAIIDVCPNPVLYWPEPVADKALPRAAAARGIEVIGELYVDLDYDREGRLVLQRQKTAVDLDKVRARLEEYLAGGAVTAVTGERVALEARSICIHGDGPNALAILTAVRETLTRHRIRIEAAQPRSRSNHARAAS
jgi:UPF0271 protein